MTPSEMQFLVFCATRYPRVLTRSKNNNGNNNRVTLGISGTVSKKRTTSAPFQGPIGPRSKLLYDVTVDIYQQMRWQRKCSEVGPDFTTLASKR